MCYTNHYFANINLLILIILKKIYLNVLNFSDKYRTKGKDGQNFMNKFPEDVKIAETLTGGNPSILLDNKFDREKKPDISNLFGEKKIQKKKCTQEDSLKKNHLGVKITHPRFLYKNDHEIRIRRQTKSSSTIFCNNSKDKIYPCHVCGFTAKRVNVIICHLKNHRLNKDLTNLKFDAAFKIKKQDECVTKKKNIKKHVVYKKKKESSKIEVKKRKFIQEVDSLNKKRKSDPELREKLLADWNVDSDEDESNLKKSVISNPKNKVKSESEHQNSGINENLCSTHIKKINPDHNLLLLESSRFLQETSDFIESANLSETSQKFQSLNSFENLSKSDNTSLKNEKVLVSSEESKEEKSSDESLDKSKLSCFDFEEDETFVETSISVKKLPRVIGCKNLSIKKEIMKEFKSNQVSPQHDSGIAENIFLEKKEIIKTQNNEAPVKNQSLQIQKLTVEKYNEKEKIYIDDKNVIDEDNKEKSCVFQTDELDEKIKSNKDENIKFELKGSEMDINNCNETQETSNTDINTISKEILNANTLIQKQKNDVTENLTEKLSKDTNNKNDVLCDQRIENCNLQKKIDNNVVIPENSNKNSSSSNIIQIQPIKRTEETDVMVLLPTNASTYVQSSTTVLQTITEDHGEISKSNKIVVLDDDNEKVCEDSTLINDNLIVSKQDEGIKGTTEQILHHSANNKESSSEYLLSTNVNDCEDFNFLKSDESQKQETIKKNDTKELINIDSIYKPKSIDAFKNPKNQEYINYESKKFESNEMMDVHINKNGIFFII